MTSHYRVIISLYCFEQPEKEKSILLFVKSKEDSGAPDLKIVGCGM